MRKLLSRHIVRARFLWVALSLTALTTIILAACGGDTTTTAPPTATTVATSAPSATSTSAVMKVQMVEQGGKYAFQPATLTIKKGTQVLWTNMSDAPHTVTSDTGAFTASSNLLMGQPPFMMTFATAGKFTYHCSIHPYMKATITVT